MITAESDEIRVRRTEIEKVIFHLVGADSAKQKRILQTSIYLHERLIYWRKFMTKIQMQLLTAMFLILLSTFFIKAQDSTDTDEPIRIQTNLVQTTLRITDRKNRPVSIGNDDIEIFVDGEPKEVSFIAPLKVKKFVILLDLSSSMSGLKMERSLKFLKSLAENAQEDQIFEVVGFADKSISLGSFSRQNTSLFKQLRNLKANGETALFRTIAERAKENRKDEIMLVITDGVDTYSTSSEKVSAENYLKLTGMLTYLIVFDNSMSYRNQEYAPQADLTARKVVDYFRQSLESVSFITKNERELDDLSKTIIKETTLLTTIGFEMADDDNLQHTLEIKCRNNIFSIQYRKSFLIAGGI